MDHAGVIQGGTSKRRRRDRAWLLLTAILLGLCIWGGTAEAGPTPDPTGGAEAACARDGGDSVELPSGATATVCEGTPAATAAEGLSIVLRKTVGTDGETCAESTEITVTSATPKAYYCYTVTNDGTVSASTHDLVDDRLGTLLSGYAYDLAPGGSTFATAAESLIGEGPVVVNVGTWTSHAGDLSDSSQAQAKVTIVDGPTAPTPVAATANEGGARITWTAPSSTGGQVITGYQITPIDGSTPGTPITTGASTFAYDVPGLTNGHQYRFDVQATTVNGPGTTGSSNLVTPQWWLPWTSRNKAVTEIFTWLTGKAPTTAQLNAFVAAANSGAKLPGDLVSELRDGADGTGNVDPVIRLYSAYFLRPPDTGGLTFWLGRRRSGWTLSRISDNFAGSSEFKRRYGSLSNQNYVKLVYQNVLGRAPDSKGLAYWTGQLDAKKKSRGQVMLNFSDSNEYKTKRARYVDAVSLLIQFLGVSPSPGQVATIETELGTAPLAVVARELIHAPSFPARAG